jgi:hypothetical protein
MNPDNIPQYPDEDCIGDGYLPVGGETLPLTQESQDSYDALKEFFDNARQDY